MEINEYKVFADKCFRDTPPPCAAVCPLIFDMREFIKLMQRGSYRSAYRLYRNHVIFPAVVSELCPGNCEGVCVRAKIPGDTAIGIKGLEKSLVARMAGKKPERYAIPKKDKKITVVGGGLAGLACAWRLSSFGYEVTVYERTGLLGGAAKEQLDPQWYHDSLMNEFTSVNVNFQMNTEITDLSSIEADAVFLATGAEENLFGGQSGIFCAPLDPTETFPEAIARGLRAVVAIEEYLKIGKGSYDPAPIRGSVDERYYNVHYDLKGKEPIPGKGEPEAYRCMSCNCSECMNVCDLMQKDRVFPKRMCNETILTLKPNLSKRTAVRMLMGCTDCGQCREVCPEHIDMGKCMEQARIDFYESGAMSPAFHDYWIEDMEFSMSEEAAFIYHKDMEIDVMFFPGCQLGASMPEYVEKTFEVISKAAKNATLYAGCCGVPALWAGKLDEAKAAADQILDDWKKLGEPLVVTACPTCLKNLRKFIPEIKIQSLYVWMDQNREVLPVCQTGAHKIYILDPCASTSETETQQAVRYLLSYAGYQVKNASADVGCCGFGGHIVGAVPELQKQFARHRLEDKEGLLVSYCANCRDVFANEGADARHILGLLLGISDEKRMPPELDERRENRRKLKRYYMGEDSVAGSDLYTDSEIHIPTELVDKMNREFVLREQVAKTILEAEAERSMILDEGDNLFYAHKRFREITVWVTYSRQGAIIEVTNLYVHRVSIRESEMGSM